MSGKMEIINVALARLGESPIQLIDEGSAPANAAKQLYDTARLATLRDYNWAFALRITDLARYDESAVDFQFAYALPSDYLRAVRLRGESPFAIRGGVLYTDSSRAVLEYVADVTDASLYDAKFIEALTHKLASELAMPVKGSPELMNYYRQSYDILIKNAAAQSTGECRRPLSDNPYLEARN